MSKKIMRTVIFFLVITQILFVGCGSKSSTSDEYVVKINNESVSKSEFMLYLYEAQKNFENRGGVDIWETDFEGKTAEDVAKESALNALKMVKITAQKSGELNIKLSDEEKEHAKTEAESSFDSFTNEEKTAIGMTQEDLYKSMEEKALFSKVYEDITKNYELSEADFKAYYDKNKETYKTTYTLFTIRTVLVDDETKAKEVHQRALKGEDFLSLVNEYEIDNAEKEKGGIMYAYKGQLESMFNVKFDMEIGDISDVLQASEGYYVIKLESKEVLPDEEVKGFVKAIYKADMEQQLFNQEYEKWLSDSSTKKNEDAWSKIKIIK